VFGPSEVTRSRLFVLPRLGLVILIAAAVAVPAANVLASSPSRGRLELSPLSSGPLVARALRSGAIRLDADGPEAAWRSGGPTPLPNVRVSTGNQPTNETPVTSNFANGSQLMAGANDYNCSTIQGFYNSNDGGDTWGPTHCMPTAGNGSCGDPIVAYTSNNIGLVGGIGNCGGFGNWRIYVQRTPDNGQTWGPLTVAVTPTFSNGLADKPWMEADNSPASPFNGSVYISATQFNSSATASRISVSHSYDGGVTWQTVDVNPTAPAPNIDQFSDLAVGADGTVYVTWQRCPSTGPTGDCGSTTASMLFSKSTDGGITWTPPAVIARAKLTPDTAGCYYGCLPNTFARVSNIPVIAIDNSSGPFAGRLYVALYHYVETAPRHMVIGVISSVDDGSTWSGPVPVGPLTNTKDMFFQWINVSQDGTVGVTWLDRRNDPSNVNYETFATVSTNGGASFLPNQKVATAPSDPFDDGFGGSFIGDYIGNTWTPERFYMVWPDTRIGNRAVVAGGGFAL
jgi:hypothetical protein